MLRVLRVIGVLMVFWAVSMASLPLTAQGTNLLRNPGFEQGAEFGGNYRQISASVEDGTIFNAAPGWGGWVALSPKTEAWMNEPPNAYPHSGGFKREGNFAQDISRGFGTFTASIYQQVPNIAEGTTLRFSVWVFQENVGESGAQTRVGIGSNAGGNPVTGQITWAPWSRAVQSWQRLTVEATVPAGEVTVFIYSTQTAPNNPNAVYYDDAELIVVGEGTPDVGGGEDAAGTPRPPTATPQTFAPFVNPQGADEGGRIVHTVQSGDTLAAISVAYGVPVSQIRQLNNLTTDILQIGQQLLIREGGAAPADDDDDADENPVGTTVAVAPTLDLASEIVTAPTTTLAAPTQPEPTEEPTEEVTEEPTEDVTEEVTEAPAEPTSSEPPTITPIPPTPTEAPPAPVESGASGDPIELEAAVCVLIFEDTDQNRIQSPGEALLPEGEITLSNAASEVVATYTTTGDEPHCFESLAMGSYTAVAMPPEGYGLTTPRSLVVNIQPGARFQIAYGAAEGVAVAAVPTPDPAEEDESLPVVRTDPDTETTPDLGSMAGLLVLGLAGVVLVGGAVIALIARRL